MMKNTRKPILGLLLAFAATGAFAQDVRFYEKNNQVQGRIDGKVAMRLTINPEGYPQDVRVVRSSGSKKVDSEAVAWMQQQRLNPVSQNGVTRSFSTIKEIKYTL